MVDPNPESNYVLGRNRVNNTSRQPPLTHESRCPYL